MIAGITACTGAGTASPPSDDPIDASGAFDWKRFDGQSITVMLNEHPWTDGVEQSLDEFINATGIDVNLETYAEDLYFDKMNQALRTQTPPDVVMTGFDYSVSTQQAAGLLEPLDSYLESASLTENQYDLADFPDGVLAPARLPAGQPDALLYGIPIATETYILFYSKDLVDQYLGGQVPATVDDLVAASQKITDDAAGSVYGSVVRGVRSSAIVDIPTAFVINRLANPAQANLPYNVWFDAAWDAPIMTSDPVVQGLKDYADLLAAGPPNRFNIDWPDANALFSQGKIAFYVDASVFGPSFEDPASSTIAGQVGYAPLPTGSPEGASGLWSWGLSVCAQSDNKGAAWLFTQWFSNKENTAALGALTGGPPRSSSTSLPVYRDALKAEYVDAVAESMSTALPTAVVAADIEPALMVIVDAVIAMANGQDPTDAAEAAQEAMIALDL
jgi:multiple sugar transport system substrate-binding protein